MNCSLRHLQPKELTLKVTACLIVHNEARVLERCLKSLSSFVDELCVVDSGSKDGSVEIARRYGARIKVRTSLADSRGRLRDFAAARNAALSMASDGWILSIDADEVLEVANPAMLRELMANRQLHAIELRILSRGVRWYLPRLFRLMPWTRWHERVHEWVEIRGFTRSTECATIINLPQKDGKESSAERDFRLCSLQLRDDATNLRAVLYLARALRQLGQYRAAIPYYARYLTESEFRAGRYVAAVGGAICHLLLHEFEAARHFGQRAYRINPKLAEACCVLGDISLGLGRLDLATRWFIKATQRRIPGHSYPFFIDPSCYGEFPLERLSWIREQRLEGSAVS